MNKKLVYVLGILLTLCSILTLMLGFGMGAGAEDTDNYSLTISYSTGCESVELTIPGQAVQKMESGVPYLIPKTNATITIRVILKNGYEIDSMTGTQGSYVLNDENCRTWTFTADDSVTLTCKPKEYEIKYLISESAGAHTQPTTGVFPKTYTFGDEGTKISIPVLNGFKFKYWILLSSKDATDESGTILSPKEGEDFVTLSATTLPNTDTLYLRPKWEANQYEVYRYDYIYDPLSPDKRGGMLNKTLDDVVRWKAPMKSEIDGSMGEDRFYPGFVFINAADYYSSGVVTVSTDGVPLNIVYRLYVPLEYALEYVSGYDGEIAFPEGVVRPEKHIYNVETIVPDPIRLGYVFQGWTVTVIKNGVESSFSAPKNLTIHDMDEAYAGDQDTVIKLTAVWVSDEYTVHIDLNTGSEEDQFDYAHKYVYDKGLSVEPPIRPGYTFVGWLINGGEEPKTGELAPFTYASDITLVAQWKANEYTVTLDGVGATKPGSASFQVIFDSPMDLSQLVLPEKEGHKLLGFATADGTYYIDAEGKSLVDVWDIPSDTTLFAKWQVLSYKVTINAAHADITLNGIPYKGTPLEFEFGTTINVVIKANAAYKVTAWKGTTIAHVHNFSDSFVLGAADVTLDAIVLPMIQAPTFKVDYVGELFTSEEPLPNGNYQIQCAEELLKIKVANGVIYVNDIKVTAITIPESFFGKTVEIVTFGDGVNTADSDPTSIALAARPELPEQNKHIGSIYPSGIDSIAVERNPASTYTYDYEFAVALNSDGTGLVWKSFAELANPKENVYLLESLNPGTIYYVYVRVKASEGNYPHGLVNMSQQSTFFTDYLNKKIDDLQKLIGEEDGEIVKALIAKAIEDAKALTKPSATFYEDLEGIYNRVIAAVPFARQQDGRIAELHALRDSLIATGEFSSDDNNRLNDLCSTAISSITAAKTGDEVEAIYRDAADSMKAVKISYLFYENAKLISQAGLPQGSKLLVQQLGDISALTAAIDEAIASGRLAVSGKNMTLAEALEAFRSLDVMAGYTLRVTRNDAVYSAFDGSYEIRVLLPETLWGVSGLQVAYYDEKSGIEVLDTERDGNYLVFTATHLADFAILGDPTMNLNPFIIALGLILACQLIAIILMLARRVKNARKVYHASFAFPTVALTIRFLPENGLMLALILGILVAVLQIVLMYLLLSTDMVHTRKKVREYDTRNDSERDIPVMAEVDPSADKLSEDTLTHESDSGDDMEEYYPIMINESQTDDPLHAFGDSDEEENFEEEPALPTEEDAEAEGAEEDESLYVDLRTGELFGDPDQYEDFIEPAANPRYSLPDEEDYPAETEGEAEDGYDAFAEAPAAAEENFEESAEAFVAEEAIWQYDDEPEEGDIPDETDDGFIFEPTEDSELDDEYDDSARGEPAQDLPQEDPITGELPEYEQLSIDDEQSSEEEETKKYDGYEE